AKTTGVSSSIGWETLGGGLYSSVSGTYDLVNSTTESSLISGAAATASTGIKIPANTFGPVGAMRVSIVGDYLNNSGANRACTIRIKFGGTVFYGDQVSGIAAGATRYPS